MAEDLIRYKRKTWWTKRVLSNDFHGAGRLSERRLKYAAESGFGTILSLFTYADTYPDVENVPEDRYAPDLPTTSKTEKNLSDFGDVIFKVILGRYDDWKTERTVLKVGDLINNSPKPVLIYCENSYASVFLLLAYHAHTRHLKDNRNGELHISDKDVFKIGAKLGYNYGEDLVLVELISKISDKPLIYKTPTTHVSIHDWYDYYWEMKPVCQRLFICGQFHFDQIKHIAKVGFKTFINTRKGIPGPNDTYFQEKVTLLNVDESVATRGDRQNITNLFTSRISKTRPKSYISATSRFNFEFINPLEFGDAVGYNDQTERRHLGKYMLTAEYYHIPIDIETGCDSSNWRRFMAIMRNRMNSGPVLIHCDTGNRSVQLALLAAAHRHRLSSSWVLERGHVLGYDLDNAGYIELIRDQLDNRTVNEELS